MLCKSCTLQNIIIIWHMPVQWYPNHRKADYAQLTGIYVADAVSSEQILAGEVFINTINTRGRGSQLKFWPKLFLNRWKPQDLCYSSYSLGLLGFRRQLCPLQLFNPWYGFPPLLLHWESLCESLLTSSSQESRHLLNLREYRIWIMSFFSVLSQAHEGLHLNYGCRLACLSYVMHCECGRF